MTVRVGDEVVVAKRNAERTVFGKFDWWYHSIRTLTRLVDWKGLSTS